MMSNNNGTTVEDLTLSPATDYHQVDEKVVEYNNCNNNNLRPVGSYGDTSPVTSNEDAYYGKTNSLFNKQLILLKELESPFDIRYKTDYFPRSGPNANKSQAPRYLHTVDGERDIIIKFPLDYDVPNNLIGYYLEVTLITVPRANQHFLHANKFQIHHTDKDGLDENPFLVELTPEHFQNGEIKVKLVIIKACKNALKNTVSLPLFDNPMFSGWTADCKTIDELEHSYELSHAQVAFSLGYRDASGRFIRFTNTTVVSNEIIEKEKPKPLDMISCPECSHSFSIKEQKKQTKKRPASSVRSTNKKPSSKRN